MAKEKKEKAGPQNQMEQITGYEQVDRIPSGIWSLDKAIGGGIPVSRIIGIWGLNACGKSTVCQVLAGTLALMGKKTTYIDAENAIDPNWAHGMGMQDAYFKLFVPEYLEQAYDGIRAICNDKIAAQDEDESIIVMDSMTSCPPQALLTASAEDAMIGVAARIHSIFFPAVIPLLRKSRTTLVMITQLRNKIGVMYGDPMKPAGGEALPFYGSINFRMLATEPVADKDGVKIGVTLKGKIAKNKTAPTVGQEFSFDALWSPKPFFDAAGDVLAIALEEGLLTASEGKPYVNAKQMMYYQGQKLGLKSAVKDLLAEDLSLRGLIEGELHQIIHLGRERGQDRTESGNPEAVPEASAEQEAAG